MRPQVVEYPVSKARQSYGEMTVERPVKNAAVFRNVFRVYSVQPWPVIGPALIGFRPWPGLPARGQRRHKSFDPTRAERLVGEGTSSTSRPKPAAGGDASPRFKRGLHRFP